MDKIQELIDLLKEAKANKKKESEKDGKFGLIELALAIAGAVLIITGIAYAVYRHFTPDYLEDYDDDDYEDDFDDYFDDDDTDDADAEKKTSEEASGNDSEE